MSKHLSSSSSCSEAAGELSACAVPAGLGSDAALRRRMLMSSLGKGSVAVAAASVSMHTLAGQSTRCKTAGTKNTPVVNAVVSGMQSAVDSMKAATMPTSNGYSCAHYKTDSNWDFNSFTKGCKTKTFKDVFGSDPTATSKIDVKTTCLNIVKNYPDSDEAHWVVAYLNGTKCFTANNYPYDSTEVKSLFVNGATSGNVTRATCVKFFTTHMEHMS